MLASKDAQFGPNMLYQVQYNGYIEENRSKPHLDRINNHFGSQHESSVGNMDPSPDVTIVTLEY